MTSEIRRRRKKKEKTTAVKYKLFGIAMPCGLIIIMSLCRGLIQFMLNEHTKRRPVKRVRNSLVSVVCGRWSWKQLCHCRLCWFFGVEIKRLVKYSTKTYTPMRVRIRGLTRDHCVECLPLPCHIKIGIVSFANKQVRLYTWNRLILTVVPVQPQTFKVAQFYGEPSSRRVAALSTDL